MTSLSPAVKSRLIALARALVNQDKARVIVAPQQDSTGFWFGGGDMIREPDGSLAVVGRYRNFGDSRTGVGSGERGLECAIFRAPAFDKPFKKIKSWSKADLTCGEKKVTSIEGTSFRPTADGVELYISTEKDVPYPADVKEFQKPGTGVWTIDRIAAADVDRLSPDSITEILGSDDPVSLHIKDPVIADNGQGDARLIYCIHPFTWSCSYSGAAVRRAGQDCFEVVDDYTLKRGHIWDVAAARVTDRLQLPRLGALADLPPLSLYFYDGAECVREHEQNPKAVKRPRGWSCEEIAGLAWGWDDTFPAMESLCPLAPLFVSPYGTGCCRYISTLLTGDTLYATWQQSQNTKAQPLVGHSLGLEEVAQILS